MPLYEYLCSKCHKRTEQIEKYSGPPLKKCPHCGGRVERLLSAPAIQFKGSGWYVTDYARSSSQSTDSKASEAPSGEKSESKSESKPAEKPAAPSKEKKKTKEK